MQRLKVEKRLKVASGDTILFKRNVLLCDCALQTQATKYPRILSQLFINVYYEVDGILYNIGHQCFTFTLECRCWKLYLLIFEVNRSSVTGRSFDPARRMVAGGRMGPIETSLV